MPRTRPDGTAAATTRRKLTDTYVRNLPPDDDRARLIWDATQPALAVLVQPSGHRAWKVIYRHNARPRWFTVGDATKIEVKDARRIAAKLVADVAEGKDPQAEKMAKRGAGTFKELRERYLERGLCSFAIGYFLRFWSPRSPSPFLTTVVALVRWSAAKERPTSSLSLNWPPLARRTYRLSPLCGSISSRGIILSLVILQL
jgi:hypothetical protein